MTKPRRHDCDGIQQRESVKKVLVPAANEVEYIAETAKTVDTNSPIIISIRSGPGGQADWFVSVKGVCTDASMRDQQLRKYRRFCNVMKHRFKITFDPMPEGDWAAMVGAAVAKAGAL